ncbi:FtsH-binding integral membrane protein [Nocardiopsis arvandica]|uniref:FtsH-binding integral membrane protein n=1 Tax=Nocardiopsis sinuspersici TaxID=501010 RepID=A0A7Z0BJP4_9ACTN|nr:FtsH-binding integral membrane protein [Nocardiopsis sinuspersici]
MATVLRLLGAARVGALGLVAVRRPGVRPPLDVRQTCASMLAAVPAYGLLSYLAWDLSASGLPEEFADGLRFLMAASALAGVVLAALAVPVRRGGHVLWRAAQAGAVVALGVSLSALYTAARLADTPLLLAGTLAAVAAIVVNIALWSTEVRRWCGL